jgi:ComF family protein
LYLPAATGLNPLATAIHRLKYGRRRVLAEVLGELLAERYPFPPTPLLVPVPLHRARARVRGFDQALLLGRVLARRRGLGLLGPRVLRRVRPTLPQAALGARARRRNLRDAFAVRDPDAVTGLHLLLVDDVMTSGATANACAEALLAAGAARVDVYTVGRAPCPTRPLEGPPPAR